MVTLKGMGEQEDLDLRGAFCVTDEEEGVMARCRLDLGR